MRQQSEDNPIGHLTSPIVSGGAVIGLKCKEGVLLATDTLLSYGGLLSNPPFIQSTTESIATNNSPTTWSSPPLESSLIFKKLCGS